MDIVNILGNILDNFIHTIIGALCIFPLVYFVQYWVRQFFPYKMHIKLEEHHDITDRFYIDSIPENFRAKNFFSRYYLKADTERQYDKYEQADNENIYIYDIMFCKIISLPLFSFFAFLNAYIIPYNIIISLQSGVPFSFFVDDFPVLCSYAIINLCLGFAFIYARQLYANFITRGYRLSNILPALLCCSNLLLLYRCSSYLNAYHPYYIFIVVIQITLTFSHLVKSDEHYFHLFKDKL